MFKLQCPGLKGRAIIRMPLGGMPAVLLGTSSLDQDFNSGTYGGTHGNQSGICSRELGYHGG